MNPAPYKNGGRDFQYMINLLMGIDARVVPMNHKTSGVFTRLRS